MIANYAALTDEQFEVVIVDEIDALSEPMDMCDSYTLGMLDEMDGIYLPPHWSKAEQYDNYVRGWNDSWAAKNGKVLSR